MLPLSSPVLALPGYYTRSIEMTDLEAWAEFEILPEVKQHTSSRIESADDLRPIVERAISSDVNAPINFAVCSKDHDRLVGVVGFHTISSLNRTAELTYTIHPGYWGKGVASASARAAVEWGFGACNWVRIQATTLEDHVFSQRILLKTGFEFEGKLRNFRMVRGVPQDFLIYSIVRKGA